MDVQLAWQSDNFTGSSVPLIESLKSKTHLITDVRKRKNLTHLRRVSLFKDSSPQLADRFGLPRDFCGLGGHDRSPGERLGSNLRGLLLGYLGRRG
jgi:hypothetical protein